MPGTPTSPDNLPIISDTDTPDIPRDMNNLANKTQEALRSHGGVFANAADLAIYIPNPSEGMSVYLLDSHLQYRFNGSTWVSAGSAGRYSGMAITNSPGVIPVGAPYKMSGWTAQTQPLLPTGWDEMDVTTAGITVPIARVYSIHCAVGLDLNNSGGDWRLGIEPTIGPTRPTYVRGSYEYGIGSGALVEVSGHWTINCAVNDVVASQVMVSHSVPSFGNAVIQLVGPV